MTLLRMDWLLAIGQSGRSNGAAPSLLELRDQ